MDENEVEFLICKQCETPTYNFEINRGKVISAYCSTCGNDDSDEFEIPKD